MRRGALRSPVKETIAPGLCNAFKRIATILSKPRFVPFRDRGTDGASLRPGEQDLVDAAAVEVDDLETPAVLGEMLAQLG